MGKAACGVLSQEQIRQARSEGDGFVPGSVYAGVDRSRYPQDMGQTTAAFVKGGFGCVLLFAVFALVMVLIGGDAWVDLGGLVVLFLIGGWVGVMALKIYNHGKKDGAGTE